MIKAVLNTEDSEIRYGSRCGFNYAMDQQVSLNVYLQIATALDMVEYAKVR